jgi:hypothetical protein
MIYSVVLATVAPDNSGIHLRLINKDGDVQIAFLEKEACGRIPENSNSKEELEKFAEVLKGRKVNLVHN